MTLANKDIYSDLDLQCIHISNNTCQLPIFVYFTISRTQWLSIGTDCRERVAHITVVFPSPDKRALWEAAITEAKQKLGMCTYSNYFVKSYNSIIIINILKS